MEVRAGKGGEKSEPLTLRLFECSDPHCSTASVTTQDVIYANLFLRGNKLVFYLKYSVVCMDYGLFRPTGSVTDSLPKALCI